MCLLQSCLSAPQEVSTWTKFCEVDIQNPLGRIEFKKIPSVSIYIKVEGSQRTVDIYIN